MISCTCYIVNGRSLGCLGGSHSAVEPSTSFGTPDREASNADGDTSKALDLLVTTRGGSYQGARSGAKTTEEEALKRLVERKSRWATGVWKSLCVLGVFVFVWILGLVGKSNREPDARHESESYKQLGFWREKHPMASVSNTL